MVRINPWRYNTPPGWNDMRTAPRDGSAIEIQNNWGIAPWFGAFRLEGGKWKQVADAHGSWVDEGPHLSWRPLVTSVEDYRDPTDGAQDSANYWLLAAGYPPRSTGSVPMAEEYAMRQQPAHSIDAPKSKKWWNPFK